MRSTSGLSNTALRNVDCLLDALNPGTTIESGSASSSAAALRDRAGVLKHSLAPLQGQSVAIHGLPAHVVEHLLALDGLAADVVVVPVNACRLFAERVLQAVPGIAVIKDAAVDGAIWPVERLWPAGETTRPTPAGGTVQLRTRWLIATSGTTSTPKLVAHTLESLARTVARKPRHGDAVWGLLYDPARFAGLQVVLQTLIGGGTLVAPDPRVPLSEQVAMFLQNGVNALSATPTLWRKLLMTPGTTDLPLRQVTLGGEIADERTLNALKAAFPAAHIAHIYASTEAGVGFAVHDGLPGFPVAWLDAGYGDVQLKLSAESTLMLRPRLRSQSYVNADQALFADDGWLDTGDLVEQVGDRVLFRGRANGSINVGGNKVMPEEVERCIEALPFVNAALVRPKASSVAGSLLEALVVLGHSAPEAPASISTIKKHCRDALASYKVPAFVRVVEQLPMTAAGKLARGA